MAIDVQQWIGDAIAANALWMTSFGAYEEHASVAVGPADLAEPFAELLHRLKDNYPFGHPLYAGQMLKPPHPVAMVGYAATMLINPNNHALDGGPATAQMEKEVLAELATMVGFEQHLGHLTSSGTIANLEALFIARELKPGLGIAYSEDAHYTHSRMCHVLGIPGHPVAVDSAGRMDVTALAQLLEGGQIGTVVVTAGTTGLGAVDPIDSILPLCRKHGVRVHVDAAYGGFFALIADDTADGVASAPWRAIASCDSVVIDPHKHGLQPYGCGAVMFADPDVGQFYAHDSPYTYFTSDDLHLGEISLECSRAGAAAAALWLTLQVFPLTPAGLGRVLRPGRRAALRWSDLLKQSDVLTAYQQPELDIVTCVPTVSGDPTPRLSVIDRVSGDAMAAGMSKHTLYLATYAVTGDGLRARGHDVDADVATGRILRSVLMKPESAAIIDDIHHLTERYVREAS